MTDIFLDITMPIEIFGRRLRKINVLAPEDIIPFIVYCVLIFDDFLKHFRLITQSLISFIKCIV